MIGRREAVLNMETKQIKETKETAAIGGKGIQKDLPEMKIANFATDTRVLQRAQEAAFQVLQRDPSLQKPENRKLAEHIEIMLGKNENSLS